MAAPECILDTHPQRQQIIDSIRSGESVRKILKWVNPPVSQATIARYRSKALGKVKLTLNCAPPTNAPTKQWAEAELTQIISQARVSARPDSLNVARGAIMDLAKLNGWEAPRRTESVSMNFHALPPAQLAQQLQALLGALPESERQSLGPVVDVPPDPDHNT